ncbi:MAG: hypothetical protein NTY33_02755 [Candidatus Moranbacteria bacterium]|nr:hypothetical protein [Candidatus Moranbacteria bacterium]
MSEYAKSPFEGIWWKTVIVISGGYRNGGQLEGFYLLLATESGEKIGCVECTQMGNYLPVFFLHGRCPGRERIFLKKDENGEVGIFKESLIPILNSLGIEPEEFVEAAFPLLSQKWQEWIEFRDGKESWRLSHMGMDSRIWI